MNDNLEKYEFLIKDITKKVSLQIINQKKTIFPSDTDIENDDIWSETRYQIIYLFRAYNPRLNIPIKNYIYKFLRKRVIDHLYKNIISIKREY